jgi:predicted glycoside hydrolase/deacetylase ChbG (UPF0249 family)
MRKHIVNTLKLILRTISSGSIQERLGYSKDEKLLIIHADDLGISRSENAATFESMEKGMVNSGSIMVPCPAFNELSDYSKTHPNADIGIHLTLTSEWSSYKWGPVLPSAEVPGITDSRGFFYEGKDSLYKINVANEVEKEFRAQIKMAIKSGIELTHIDSHMYVAFTTGEIIKKYISIGKEYKLPVLLTYDLPISSWFQKNTIVVDQLYCAKPEDYVKGLKSYYEEAIKTIKPGLNCILVHVAFNNKEMQDITLDQQNFGSAWRQADFDFFTSVDCRQLVENHNIKLITWREIRDKLVR